VNSVTTPKLEPPPLIPQYRSLCSSSDAVTISPFATTIRTERRLSMEWPYWPVSHPEPPPRVNPAIPFHISVVSIVIFQEISQLTSFIHISKYYRKSLGFSSHFNLFCQTPSLCCNPHGCFVYRDPLHLSQV
jgi:hypothetical protein